MVEASPRSCSLREDERLEQFERHLLRQTALMQTQRRTDHDDRTTGVVDALAEQVLTETTLLALDHVGERLERALVGASDRTAAAAVIEQRIHRFLQHALFVAHDDVRRVQLEEPAQTVVAVDDATIQIVQVRGRKAAAIQRHQRTQIRRQHRQHGQHHPLRLVAGLDEGLEQLQALGEALDLGFRVRAGDLFANLQHFRREIQRLQQLEHGFGAHAGIEFIAVLLDGFEIQLVGQQLAALQLRHARLDHDERFEIEHALDLAQRHVEHQADTRWQRLQEPDVRGRAGQLDVTHALATHLRLRHFDAALFADHAAMLQTLVLAAQALVVLYRSEDLRAEKTVTFRLERAVVDGLRLLHFAVRPRADHFRRGEPNTDRVEILDRGLLLEQLQ